MKKSTKPKASQAPKTVLVEQVKAVRWAYDAIIPYMREHYGTRFVILTHDASLVQNWCGENDKIILRQDVEADAMAGNDQDVDQTARENEEKYGIVYMRDVIQQSRQLSTGFLSHAPWSPVNDTSSFKRDSTTRQLNGFTSFAEKIIEDENIDLLLVWPLCALTACLANVATAKNIPVTYPYGSNFKSYQHWSPSAFSDDTQHHAAYEKQVDCDPIPMDEIMPPANAAQLKDKFDDNYSLATIIKQIAKITFFRLEFFVLDIIKLDFRLKKRMSYTKNVLQHLYKWWFYKKISSIAEKDVEAFSERPFLYYSLSLEPEFSTQGKSKGYNDQASIIRQLAMNLPAGYDLVFKEHIVLGRRHLAFYSDLTKFPNVKMAHPSVRGIDLAAKARAVAVLTGSVTLEATLLGKPVVEFSTHSAFSFLPNVSTVTSFHELSGILKRIMSPVSEDESKKIQCSGARLTKAIEDISFDASKNFIFNGTGEDANEDEKEKMSRLLVELYQTKTSS